MIYRDLIGDKTGTSACTYVACTRICAAAPWHAVPCHVPRLRLPWPHMHKGGCYTDADGASEEHRHAISGYTFLIDRVYYTVVGAEKPN